MSRTLTKARRRQGFRSQEHLNAFYRYYDHDAECDTCGAPEADYWNEADASWQPTTRICPTGRELRAEWDRHSAYYRGN